MRLPGLVRATHAGPTAAVTAYATATAASSGLAPGRVTLLGAAVLLGQCSVGWGNDWVDAPRDRRTARLGKPVVAGDVRRGSLGVAALVAVAGSLALSFALGPRPGAVHLVALVSAWLYNAGVKATVASPVPYLVSFGCVPVLLVAAALPGHPLPPAGLALAAGLVGGSAHFTNAVKDLAADEAEGVRGLPQRLGLRRSGTVSAFTLVAAVAALATSGQGVVGLVTGGLGAASLALAVAVVVAAARGHAERLFAASLAAAAPLVAVIAVTGGVAR